MRRVISLYLPTWPTDRLRKLGGMPHDPRRPLLVAARQGSRRMITAVDAQGAALGICAGMAVAHAQAMVPDLAIEEADQAADASALGRLAAWCVRQATPLAAPNPPDGVWLDVTGCTHLFGGEAGMMGFLTSRLADAEIGVRAAMAETPGAAHALARYSQEPVTIACPGGMRSLLEPLPVAALRLEDDTVQGLRRLGFETIGALMRTPRAPLSRRFGGNALRRLDQALGHAPEPIAPLSLADMPRARLGFPEPIATPDDLARATGLLVDALCEKLRRRGLGANRLDLVFQRVDGASQAIRIGTAAATREAGHLLRLLLPQIETIDPGFGIEAMLLTASLTARLDARQSVSSLREDAQTMALAGLVDVLSNRFGADGIFCVHPVESDLPERSFRPMPPLTRTGANWPGRLPRPTRLFDPPRRVEAMALLPDHPPVRFTWQRCTHLVRRADGPERVFGEWWASPDEVFAVRDYFQVEDENGQRFWLFRRGNGEDADTGDMQWFLHGVFG
jgi:protein ImuB